MINLIKRCSKNKMFDIIQPIYKTLIYKYCDLFTLQMLSLTCHKINEDQNRKLEIINKIKQRFGVQHYNYKYNIHNMEYKLIFDKMPKYLINSISELYTASVFRLKIDYELKINFDTHLFFDSKLFHLVKNQKQIIVSYLDLLQDIANQKENIFNEWETFYYFSICSLHKMFIICSDELKIYLYHRIKSFKNHPYNYWMLFENFITDITSDLISGEFPFESIIDIGLFLKKEDSIALKLFLELTFGNYIEIVFSTDPDDELKNKIYDRISESLDQMLSSQSKIDPFITNEDILEELLLD